MKRTTMLGKGMLLAITVASGISVSLAAAQSTAPAPSVTPAQSAAPAKPAVAAKSAASAKSAVAAKTAASAKSAATAKTAATSPSAAPAQRRLIAANRPQPTFAARNETMYYQSVWGVDSFKVKWTESGEIVRFSWRVVDPNKAAALNDKKAEPQLFDKQAGVSLVVPAVSNVGKMRQASTPKDGVTYWMAFSNVGRRVKKGDRVAVVIGSFKAENLVVE